MCLSAGGWVVVLEAQRRTRDLDHALPVVRAVLQYSAQQPDSIHRSGCLRVCSFSMRRICTVSDSITYHPCKPTARSLA